MSTLRNIRHLLDRNASFTFDLLQYLQSLKYAKHLRSRGELFQNWLSGAIDAQLTKGTLFHELHRSLVNTVPAYMCYGSTSTFENLPFIDKQDLQIEGSPFIRKGAACNSNVGDLWHTTTFGTTDEPVSVFYSPAFYFEYLHLSIWKLSNRFTDGAVNDGVYALCIDDNAEKPEFVTLDPSGLTGVMVRILIDPMESNTITRAFALIEKFRPTVVATRPSLFEVLMAYANVKKLSLDVGMRCVFSAGSFLKEETRQEVEKLFGAPVLNCYGLAEFGYAAGECGYQSGYHIDETSVLIELIDPNGIPVVDGMEGEIVVSSTVNETMPLIRFRTGDLSTKNGEQCPCGSPSPRLMYIKGHGPFHYCLPDGVLLHPARLYPLVWLFPLRDFQVIEEAPGSFHVQIDPYEKAPSHITDKVATYVRGIIPSASSLHVSVQRLRGSPNFKRFRSASSESMIGRD